MAALDFQSFDFALKEMYSDQVVQNIFYKKNPFLALIPKDEGFLGDVYPQPIIFANPQGRSASLANAITNNQSTKGTKFVLKTFSDYGVVKIDHKTLKASAGNAGAFIEARKTEIDGMLAQLGRSCAIALYRNGSGSIGQIASGQATATITLSTPSDATNFEVGMTLNVSATDGGGAGVRTGTVLVTGVDVDAGTITASATWVSTIAAVAANDYIFVQGDYDQKLPGLAGYIPSPASGARTVTTTPFFGVDRSPQPSRLAGVYFDGTTMPIEEALIELVSRVYRQGGSPDYIFTSFAQFVALEKSLGSKVTYMNPAMATNPQIGFKGIVLAGPDGPVTVMADINCPNTKAYAIQMDTWKLRSTGKVPTLYDTDGLTMLRGTTTDDVEIRSYYYAVLANNAPGFNGVASLTAA